MSIHSTEIISNSDGFPFINVTLLTPRVVNKISGEMKEALIEFIEVITYQILYLRGLYPSQIFRKQKAYSLPVFNSIYPPLNHYVKNVLSESLTLLNVNKLKRFEIRIYKAETILESFIVDLSPETITPNCENLEDEFRSCLHSLETRCKAFRKVSRNCRFKIFLHTENYRDYKKETKCNDFMWIKTSNEQHQNKSEIVPIAMNNSNQNLFQFYVELHK